MKGTLRLFSRNSPTHFCACSEYAGRWLFGNRLYDSGRVEIINNAIDLTRFRYDHQAREAIRVELNIMDKFVIGHVGRFMKQKNHTFLIDVFKQIHMQDSNAVLLLVGEGELEQAVRDKVERLKLADCVFFLGIRSDVHKLFSAMDVFLLPSLYEGLPVVGIEAQSSGLPIAASDTVTKEAKLTKDFMFISLEQSAKEWATRILKTHTLKPLCVSRESVTEQIADAGYDIGSAAERLLHFYKKIV